MTDNDDCDMQIVTILNPVEEDYAPERVKKDNAKCQCSAGHEKHFRATFQSHCSWSDSISKNVYTLEQLKRYRKVN